MEQIISNSVTTIKHYYLAIKMGIHRTTVTGRKTHVFTLANIKIETG